MKNQKEYVVNVGNIGNITCDTRKEAEQVYNKYVAMSKSGKGRAGNEHVSLMIDGEPVKEHFADKEEYAKGSTINKSLPEKLYVSCHLGNTFEYLKENKAYIHGLSSSKNYDFIAYKNTINYNKSMDYYELEFDVKKMLNLGFKIQNLNELYPDVGFGKDSYNIIVPEKYIIKGTKDEKGYTIKSDLLKDVKDYITKVNVLLNNYSLVDIDWSDESTAESDYGQKEFIEKNGKTNITTNYINKVNKGDKMSKVMTWGNQSYAKGTNVTKFSDYGSYWNAVVDYIYKENKGKIERSVIEDEANKSDALLQNMFNEEDFNLDTASYVVMDNYFNEYRTGGVAGSKHVDVTRGRRLIHGYKAVKGTDKNFNYSKGHKGVKVTPGYRLPHGYETTEAAYNEKYRTGGVAGSKHVDVVRGYRLVHGYKAVKGTDKGTNYSKGYPKVKVDSGWRLPHGYEVVEAYYNDKYSRGGLFGSSAVVKDINDEFASDELKSKLQSKMKKDDVVIAFAYTDYGGDFFDKVLIEYFEENYPDNIVVENTGWSGQNAFVFGTPAEEFVEATENYPLGFEDTESFYYEKQYEEEQEGFARFIEDDLRDYDFDTSEVMQELNEKFGGYWNVLTTGLDYSYSDMIDHLKEKGLIKEKAAKGKNVKKETLLDKIKSAGAISENQVNLVKNRMNRGAIDSETQEVIDYVHNDEVKLTPEQNQKGIKFLRNLYKSPTGKVRTNNPFGNREISALDSFTHFLIVGFQNIGNSYRDNYVPVYAVIGKNGTFEYYYDGDVNVVGAKGMTMYRTGGVAGSKHVDVAKGYRLPHGYQAVKGSDKNFDYSKGYPKVKVDKGWRLPKGYEVVDGAYNMKYMAGGSFDIHFEEYLQKDDSNFYKEYKNNKFSVFTEQSGEVVEVTIDEAIDLLLNMSIDDIATLSSSTTVERISQTKYEINTGGDKGGSGVMDPNYYISHTENPKNDLYFVVLNAFREEVIENKIMPDENNSSITESQYHRAVNHFVYFCMNYPSNFMDAFSHMREHLQSKYNSIYERVGAKAAMITFYTELDSENQKALLSWAMNNYKGTKLEEGGMMGTYMLSSFDIMKKGKNVDSKCSYTILKANRAYCGVHDKTYSEAVETAKNHQCHNGLIIKGEMIWTNGRVKGIRLADGEEMMYGEYEREYFTEPQMKELKKLSKSK